MLILALNALLASHFSAFFLSFYKLSRSCPGCKRFARRFEVIVFIFWCTVIAGHLRSRHEIQYFHCPNPSAAIWALLASLCHPGQPPKKMGLQSSLWSLPTSISWLPTYNIWKSEYGTEGEETRKEGLRTTFCCDSDASISHHGELGMAAIAWLWSPGFDLSTTPQRSCRDFHIKRLFLGTLPYSLGRRSPCTKLWMY